jgi:tRNA (guanine37-N1)-methyltransferase
MLIDILTLFPEMFKGPFDESIIKRAREQGLVEIEIHNLRDWATDKHKTVDDHPFGGGVGMVLKVDVIDRAVQDLTSNFQFPISNQLPNSKLSNKKQKGNSKNNKTNTKVVLLDAGGNNYTQKTANEFSKLDHLILIAGHYEGVDHRVHKHIADEIYSIGDYVLTGGEIPAMVITDSLVRLIPGVLDKVEATQKESFSEFELPSGRISKLLEYPQYTRPEKYLEWDVPKVLMSGNHKEIEKWRLEQSIVKTKKIRPDLIKKET